MDKSPNLQEEVLYEGSIVDKKHGTRAVVITPQRVTIGSVTYSTANITSVSIAESTPARWRGIAIAIIGAVLGIASLMVSATYPGPSVDQCLNNVLILAVILVVVGVIMVFLAKGRGYLAITTAAGQVPALWSDDRELIRRLVSHIEKAIISRG